jgi:hypothetical protein
MECQTIEKAESTWQVVESLTDTITHPDIFPKGNQQLRYKSIATTRRITTLCTAMVQES